MLEPDQLRKVIHIREPVPLIGSIAFGIIDRGTNVIQVRVSSVCALCCVFCSVDAGPCSKRRWADYLVDDVEWLGRWVSEVVRYKRVPVEVLLDGIGDPLEHPDIVSVVKVLKEIDGVKSVALETHGYRLTKELAYSLAEAGLDRINLSIDTLDPEKAKYLTGRPEYDIKRVMEVIEEIVAESEVDVHLTPVLIPGVNEEDVKEVILWGKRIGVGKRWPPFTVQKYVVHKRGRKIKGVKEMTWDEFWKWIEETEKELGVRLRWSMEEWGMRYAPKIPELYEKGKRVKVEIIARGLLRGEWLAVPLPRRDVVMTVTNVRGEIGRRVTVKVRENKDNIYLASP